jgi:ribose transport system ATP-binding protein
LVEIARSVAIGCKVLVLDEPTSSITSRDVANLFGLMRRLRDRGIAIIYISHFLEEIAQISDRYTVLRDGKSVGTGITKETTSDAIVQKMVGRQVETLYPRTKRTASETVLRVSNVAGKRLPIDASLELRRGEVLGIAGLIGSGRTELIRAIYGLDSVEHGQVQIAMLRNITPAKMWECGAGLVSEDRKQEGLALKLSIADNMTLPRLSGLGPLGLVFPAKQRAACKPLIQQLSIRCHDPDQQVGQLSGGNQQKVAIARLLHSQADILIFDEPTRGIDVGSKAQIYQLIDRLVSMPDANGKCKAVLFISSYLPELLGMCDRIHVMRRGVLNPARTALGLTEHDIMLEATGVGTKE